MFTVKPYDQLFVLILFCLAVFSQVGCKKLIEVEPPIQSVSGREIYSTNSSAATVVAGIYLSMTEESFLHGLNGISLRVGLSSDEFKLFDGNFDLSLDYLYRNVNSIELGNLFWNNGLYSYIFRCNSAIDGITSSTGISSDVKNQLLGELLLIRSFCYFYLVNLYGDVPLVLTTDTKTNSLLPRANSAEVYDKIISDLLSAENLLNEFYVGSDSRSESDERVRPNKSVSEALLARVYLYTSQWEKAEYMSSKVINNDAYSLSPLDQVFLKNSSETIWALKVTNSIFGNKDGIMFNLMDVNGGPNSSQPVSIADDLFNSFEYEDDRRNKWVDSVVLNSITYRFPHKYITDQTFLDNNVVEYPMVLRLSEQYLIRAEARAHLGNLSGANSASSDLNIIRNRAGLKNKDISTSLTYALDAILKERRVEFFSEWGNRWFDLKRMDKIDQIMNIFCPMKGAEWLPFKRLYPIPGSEFFNNPSLRGHQNLGYPES